MKKILILFLTCMMLITSVVAQSSEEKAIATNVEALRKAMIGVNKPIMDNLTAKDLSYGHSTGKIENKAEFLEMIISGKNVYKKIELSDQTINIVEGIAIVRHTFNAEVENNGVLQTAKLGVMQIWNKQQNKWKLLARQAFKL